VTTMQERTRGLNRVPDAPVSLRDRAYQEIKRRINKMEFRPGAYLNEAQISRTLRIGRTPVHQALDRLMLEGLVQVIPRKGVMVETISLDQVLQIIDVRLVNEPFCVGLAAERATPVEVSQFRALLDSAGPLIRARDREQLMDLDRQFHWKISLAAKNAVLADTISRLHDRSLRFWFISLGDDLQLRRVDEEHRAILDAIARRDALGASDAMRHHIESSRKHIARTI
jgi:GntR family transcriptional regulator, rspAB operon transcriptional repressor